MRGKVAFRAQKWMITARTHKSTKVIMCFRAVDAARVFKDKVKSMTLWASGNWEFNPHYSISGKMYWLTQDLDNNKVEYCLQKDNQE